jgi:site-specific DNA-methyltransferase (adenine-specific)
MDITAPATEAAKRWQGWGTALKPALEPITVARKTLGEKTVAANVLAHGTGAINVDGCRVGTDDAYSYPNGAGGNGFHGGVGRPTDGSRKDTPQMHAQGRWPANLIHDGSDQVIDLFPQSGNGNGSKPYSYAGKEYNNKETSMFNGDKPKSPSNFNDSGSAARFFYCAKASKKDRDEGCEGMEGIVSNHGLVSKCSNCGLTIKHNGSGVGCACENRGQEPIKKNGNFHPTVKPTDLMRYLCRLVTPPVGVVLDPFMGSGSTGKAAVL